MFSLLVRYYNKLYLLIIWSLVENFLTWKLQDFYSQGISRNFKKSRKVRGKLEDQEDSGNFTFQSQGNTESQGKSANLKVPWCKS